MLGGGICDRNSIVAPITVSSASRYFFTTSVLSAMTKSAEEQARRSFETVMVHRVGERKRQ